MFKLEPVPENVNEPRLTYLSRRYVNPIFKYNALEHACRQDGYQKIAGIDEVGRGALAGPVVAAAVILSPHDKLKGLRDSKQLTSRQRERLFEEIYSTAISIGIGSTDSQTIDRLNILNATLLAMQEAVKQLTLQPDYLLVDGLDLPKINIATKTIGKAIPKGDSLSPSIAAASVIAKVTRDRLMQGKFQKTYPNYGFRQHKGYPTVQHREAIKKFGPSQIHRHTFKLLADTTKS